MVNIETIIEQTVDPERCGYGFSCLEGLLEPRYGDYPHAITLVRRLDDDVIDELLFIAPTRRYFEHYRAVNSELDGMLDELSGRLGEAGIVSVKIRPTFDEAELENDYLETLVTPFSHKMAATRAGLGWIGKTALFISEKYGPRVRLATLLTDTPLPVSNSPCDVSRCGDCAVCVDACPAGAANGVSWKAGMERDAFFDAFKCRAACRELAWKNIGVESSICGICVAACPMGKKGGLQERRPGPEFRG